MAYVYRSQPDLQGDAISSQVITRRSRSRTQAPVVASRYTPVDARDTDDLENDDDYASEKLKVPVSRTPHISFKHRAILLFVAGAIAVLIILQLVSAFNAWRIDQDNTYNYGPTRTSASASVVLGLGDSASNPSIVSVSNLYGNIVVTILPGGDATKLQVYHAPYQLLGSSANKTPVTFKVDKSGDIQLHIDGQASLIMLTKSGDKYVVSGN